MDLILFYLNSRNLLQLRLTCKKLQIWIDEILDQCQHYGFYAKRWPDIYLKLTDKKYKKESIHYHFNHSQRSLDFIIDSINYLVTILSDDYSNNRDDILLQTLDIIKAGNPFTRKKIDSLCTFKFELIKNIALEETLNLDELVNYINDLFSEGEIHSISAHKDHTLEASKMLSLQGLINTLVNHTIKNGNPDNIRLNNIIKQLYYQNILLKELDALYKQIILLEKRWNTEHPIAHHVKILYALPKRLFLTSQFQKVVYYSLNLSISLLCSLGTGVASAILVPDVMKSWGESSMMHSGLKGLALLGYLSLCVGHLYIFIYTALRGESPAENETLSCWFNKISPIDAHIEHEKNNHPSIKQLCQYHYMLCAAASCGINKYSTLKDLINHLNTLVKTESVKLQNFISSFNIYGLKYKFKRELRIKTEGESEDHKNQRRIFLATHTLFGKNTVTIDTNIANPCCSINIHSLLFRLSKLRQEVDDEVSALSKKLGLTI